MLLSFEKLIGIIGLGTTVGGGLLINSFIFGDESPKTSSPKLTIADLLKAGGLSPLNFDTTKTEEPNSVWDTVLSDYRNPISEGQTALIKLLSEKGIEGVKLTLGADRNENINKLKIACSRFMNIDLDMISMPSADKDKALASVRFMTFCVEPASVELMVSWQGGEFLDTQNLDSFKKEATDSFVWSPEIRKFYNVAEATNAAEFYADPKTNDGLFEKFWKDCKRWKSMSAFNFRSENGKHLIGNCLAHQSPYASPLSVISERQQLNLFKKEYIAWREGGRSKNALP
ncbi:hypothetical protein HF1_12770 [Mycoplasma haemofelis str. Langford 1]|uniref:Uncharacterized protein n=1 Tax=Mycoplasma haemofelis (strain Langford 1) TaxID=941640 RepID=E8ZJG4_MYCHL|nr:hypothetical protein [Mycoplasma haemofelis]CBY93285.1 hypothetical protein HF1_12770 [Mycoplasma haemofelis str. Langford 1]